MPSPVRPKLNRSGAQVKRPDLYRGEFDSRGKRHRPQHEGEPPDPVDMPVSAFSRGELIPMRNPPPLPDDHPTAPPPPAGYRYSLLGKLVPLMETRVSLATHEGQAIFLEVLELTGSTRSAMDAIGMISHSSLQGCLDRMPELSEAYDAAMDRHRATIYKAAHARAVHGYDVPIVGGQFKDTIVAYERRYSDGIMALMLKRHFKEFADTSGQGAKVTINNTNQTAALGVVDLSKLNKEQRSQLRGFLAAEPDPPQEETTEEGVLDVEAIETDPK